MENIIDPIYQRQVSNSFYLHIPLQGKVDEEIRQLIAHSMHVEQATRLMVEGSIDIEDLLEYVEPVIPDMDDYIDEVEESLIEVLTFSNYSTLRNN